MDIIYDNVLSSKPALKALNLCNYIHCLYMLLPIEPNILSITSWNCTKSFIISHIDYLRTSEDICQLFLIQRAMVTGLNLTVSLTCLPCTISRYSKLSYNPTSLRLVLCFLIYIMLKEVISFCFFCRISYKPKSQNDL